MKLIVQPDDGPAPILLAIGRARSTIDIMIFRLDMREVVQALGAAVQRGVVVRALVAHTNKGDEKGLRRLEQELLEMGVTVARTADDLVRYHGKMMIVDGRTVHVHGFNFTRLDINKSRSFGVIASSRAIVEQARRLFEADCTRQRFTADHPRLVVSPVNARKRLAAFISGARRQLLIYDTNISDPQMVKLLTDRQQKGVDVRIIGATSRRGALAAEPFPGKRLHIRCMIRDGSRAFIGSQSLRTLELERRREVGIFIHESPVVKRMRQVFEDDWSQTATGRAAVALAEAHATAMAAADAAKAAAAEADDLSETSAKAAQQALAEAEKLAAQAKAAAKDAEDAARRLARGGDAGLAGPAAAVAAVAAVADVAAAVDDARDAAKQAKEAVKEVSVAT